MPRESIPRFGCENMSTVVMGEFNAHLAAAVCWVTSRVSSPLELRDPSLRPTMPLLGPVGRSTRLRVNRC